MSVGSTELTDSGGAGSAGAGAGMSGATRPIPLSSPYVDERDEELVLEVLRSGRLSLGPAIDRFEELFAERVGAPYAAAVSSGTAGLHLLAALAGLGEGDEAITSPYSFVASANCVVYEGATPVFADVDERTMNLDPAAAEAAITERTKAIVAVDIFGYPCELDELRALCDRHGLVLIQDACEALGARYKGEPVGSQGVDAVFAFYPNKQMTTGEGGIVTTHDEETWRRLVSLRNQGRADGGGWLEHARLGYNYRIDDIRAALGIGQLEKLDTILALREAAAARYGELLAGVDGVEVPLAHDADHVRSWFVYVVTLARGTDRERVIAELERQGIASSRYLPSIHLQPYMRERYGFREGLCPVSEDLSQRTLALPFFSAIAAEDQERVADALAAALG
jgi:perosamine synthetase